MHRIHDASSFKQLEAASSAQRQQALLAGRQRYTEYGTGRQPFQVSNALRDDGADRVEQIGRA